jgi:hypothetical protein
MRKPAKFNIPRVDSFESYKAETAKLTRVLSEKRENQQLIDAAISQQNDDYRAKFSRERQIAAAAERFRADPTAGVATAIADRATDPAEYSRLRERHRVLLEAERQQRIAQAEEQTRVSRQICDQVRPQAVALVERLTKALIELARAQTEIAEFKDELFLADVKWLQNLPLTIGLSPSGSLGRLDDQTSRIRGHLRERQRWGLAVPKLPEIGTDKV